MKAQYLQIEPNLPGLGPESIEYANRLHGTGEGYVFLCHKPDQGRRKWEQNAVPVGQLESYLRDYPKSIDVYLSQNRFNRKCRFEYALQEADALWADLDYYRNPDLADLHPELIADEALLALDRHRIPEPTAIISSGKGLYFLWLHRPIPIRELYRWKECQLEIYQALKSVGADRGAIDASRVLRLPGTKNSKNGRTVEVLHESSTVWDFEDIFREIVGESERTIVHPFEYEVAKRRNSNGFFSRNRWNAKTLWGSRFQELRALKDYRWPHGVPEGFRDLFVFLCTVGLSWMIEPRRLEAEAKRWGRECVGRFDREALTNTRTTIKRAMAAARGERIEWRGIEVDPRYRFRTETIVDRLEITESEARELNLRSLVPKSLLRERDALRKRECRRPSPIQTDIQSQYRTKAEYWNRDSLEKEAPWENMEISRATYFRRKRKGELE